MPAADPLTVGKLLLTLDTQPMPTVRWVFTGPAWSSLLIWRFIPMLVGRFWKNPPRWARFPLAIFYPGPAIQPAAWFRDLVWA